MGFRVAVDIGGTFTDLVTVDTESGEFRIEKTSSDKAEPIAAVMNVIERAGVDSGDIDFFIHGTTVTTNALLERKGSRVAFITNRGLKDVVFIQHGNRRDLYTYQWRKPLPLSARRDCFELDGRVDRDGNALEPVDREQVAELAGVLEREGITAVAVSMLFSYVNPAHELEIAEILRQRLPELDISLSHQIYPRWRESDRGNTTIADAYLKPLFREYVHNLDSGLDESGVEAELLIMKSNGGVVNADVAADRSIDYLVSGPAGGVKGGTYFAAQVGCDRFMSMDIGGTSCDVSLVMDGVAKRSEEFVLDVGLPICAPMVDIHTIGAGGGSIAWIDRGGMLRVGPESAGSNPGPASYGRGGERPTLTDANLVLGRISAERFAGGQFELRRDLAYAAVESVASQISMSVEEAALAIVELANHNMVNALNVISVEQGVDPRSTALVAFGGAGPLHAAEIGNLVGVERVIVPPHPGNVSAFGLLTAGLRVDVSQTLQVRSDSDDAIGRASEVLTNLRDTASESLASDGFTGTPGIELVLEARYQGQNHYRNIVVDESLPLDADDWQAILNRFHADYLEFYGYQQPENVVEIVGAAVTAIGPEPELPAWTPEPLKAAEYEDRRTMHFADGAVEGDILQRENLKPGERVEGPAVVEERLSTTFVPPGMVLEVHASGNMIIEEKGA